MIINSKFFKKINSCVIKNNGNLIYPARNVGSTQMRLKVIERSEEILQSAASDADVRSSGHEVKQGGELSPIEQVRQSLPVIPYVDPSEIKYPRPADTGSCEDIRRILKLALLMPGQNLRSAIETLNALSHQIPIDEKRNIEQFLQAGEKADFVVHDQFFGIRRTRGQVNQVLADCALRSVELLHLDLGQSACTLPDERVLVLDRGLRAVAALCYSLPIPAGLLPERSAAPMTQNSVARRWVRGHHIFTSLTQGLTMGFNALEIAEQAQDREGADYAAAMITLLMEASAASLEFTGNFPAHFYDAVVRGSMSPPNQPDGFSGLLSRDHRQLVKRMKETGAAIEALKSRSPEAHRGIYKALSSVYESHSCVCEKFVGSDSSLLMAGQDQKPTGLEQLEKFKAMRLKSIDAKAASRCPHQG